MTLNSTHDSRRESWVDSANRTETDFPLQNLPIGAFSSPARRGPSLGVAIGEQIVDLGALSAANLLPGRIADACCTQNINTLLALGPSAWSGLRQQLSELLGEDTCPPGPQRDRVAACLVPQSQATMLLPAAIGDYTDFYASIDHAGRVGAMFRPDQPLLPNYKWVPIGYHGRASSIIISGTDVRRPRGQAKGDAGTPHFGPSRQLDYELELAALIGPGNRLGEPVPVATAPEHLFGVLLLNDWSARDIQSWEYQPLGPFLAKSFATSISPWVVTWDALAPFRIPAAKRPAGDPAPLPHLADANDALHGGLDLHFEILLRTARMSAAGLPSRKLAEGRFATMYWTFAQLLAHHTSNGCNLRPGDLLASGTISGPEPEACGCLLELTARGTRPVTLPNGESRAFLEDGDEVVLRGWAQAAGFRRIGLGECRGTIFPARE
ncbi:MAG TPA: fumarylacetoacetase [Candidatus Didemnitutus sp.]|nr:fumarylacetoacetase [Candidatus Didemnitutus sp.]